MGYRRIRDELRKYHNIYINDKRVLRLCRAMEIHSSIKYQPKSCTKAAKNPYHVARNYLNRDFYAEAPNKKWVTDVSEFKYYIGIEVHKVYLSAILDLFDKRVVSFEISDHNDNPLVISTFNKAIEQEPDAQPLLHSDRGYQYTSKEFCTRLKAAKMKQSMSRVAHCLDNGPMEGFWGIMKRESYYGRRFTNHDILIKAMTDYINYYNNRRVQRKLSIMSPMEYHANYLLAA